MSASLSRRPTQGNAIRQFPCLSIPNTYDFSLSPCPVIFTATEDDDCIIDSNYDDIFNTLGDNDIVMASTGNDLVEGGQGQDVLAGGDGNDTLYGGAGNDIGYGDDGDDFLYGEADDGPLFVGGYSFDTITDYQAGDLIDAPNASGTITTSAGTVSSSAGKTIRALLGLQFGANGVAAFQASSWNGTFVAINDNAAGFKPHRQCRVPGELQPAPGRPPDHRGVGLPGFSH